MKHKLLIAKGKKENFLLPNMATRHGLITGSTGTGKTVSLQVLAENFSEIGVPVFLSDVKGDLAGLSEKGILTSKIKERLDSLNLYNFNFQNYPVVFWDIFGKKGHPLRTTISEIGPILLSRILNLNEVQSGVLSLVFKIADDNRLLLLDLKDLKAILKFALENSSKLRSSYGNISATSIGAIERAIINFEQQNGEKFFGEPAFTVDKFFGLDENGKGIINILVADTLILYPKLYATFLLWLLSELFENLPEIGETEKPRLVFFFDEAHFLFSDLPNILLDKIEQTMRMIRSKGVSIFFITQSPLDLPETILGQIGNKIQHALRAYTPKEQKVVRTIAESFRTDSSLNLEKVILELKVGEALVSFLTENGEPDYVDRALILPPKSQIGTIDDYKREEIIKNSRFFGVYDKLIDRESAYEILAKRTFQIEESLPKQESTDTLLESLAKNALKSASRELGRQILRGVFGTIFRRR